MSGAALRFSVLPGESYCIYRDARRGVFDQQGTYCENKILRGYTIRSTRSSLDSLFFTADQTLELRAANTSGKTRITLIGDANPHMVNLSQDAIEIIAAPSMAANTRQFYEALIGACHGATFTVGHDEHSDLSR